MKKRKHKQCFSEEELQVINRLSDVAKERFWTLDMIDQKKLLRKAERLKEEKQFEFESKEKFQKKNAKAKRFQKTRMGSESAKQGVERYAWVLNGLLVESKQTADIDRNDPESSQEASSSPNVHNGLVRDAFLYNGIPAKDLRKRYAVKKQQQKMGSEMRKGTSRMTKMVKSTSNKVKHVLIAVMKGIAKMLTSSLGLAILFIVIVVAVLVSIVAFLLSAVSAGSNGSDSSTYQAQVSEKTESYRAVVEKYCDQYEIEDFVDLCLAVMEQESGGNGTDVMQAEQSYYNTDPPIDTPEESINCGVHELSDCLKKSAAERSGDIPQISLALQGYNFGNGYIAWALKNYNGYSLENAELFSRIMCNRLGLSTYGDIDYVPHVLRYYIPNENTSVTNTKAAELIKELKENNQADPSVWKVIEKGASLVGKVTYGMLDPPRQDDGRDHPTVLDCSSFVAWSFHKSGYNRISYSSTTATFIQSNSFTTVDASDLQVGDIGLKSETAPTGGANHVGIYCGKLKNGTKIWLHCTSSSSTSFTGNTSGAMMGAYTNFTYFRRLNKWNK